MAVEPLFVETMAALKAATRLTGCANPDGLAVIDQAVQQVRQEFYRQLGATRIAQIVAISYEENPTTDEEFLRLVANTCEVKWVRYWLSRTMTVLFKDASGNSLEAWNQEEAFRDGRVPRTELNQFLKEILEEVAFLRGGTKKPSMRCDLVEPDVTPPLPGDSIWGPFATNLVEPLEEDEGS